ncbi:MAG: hypothetical protein O2909_07250 [Chloroflexi bacterium]|nr:hypothetical protein [Chloroflexota bacterium]MDA1219221.1 hypothetical protein [Chloroflexota bacterium]PKB57582.1 MAG: hypothetical protein BZY73_02415 [SAR202 cluster bacterium Casp-Chloro-G3]
MDIQKDHSNLSTTPANIYSHLASTEKVLSVFGPFYATSHRVLRLDPPNGLSRGHLLEIPYSQLVSVEMVRRANHPVLALGTAMIILGLFIMPVLPISAVLTLPIGGGILYLGAKGKPGYFQLMAHNMPKEAEKYWQVAYSRSGNFIATVRSVIGQMPEF